MADKHFVVQGAKLKCMFSVEPKTDILKVKTQSKHYINDVDGEEKPTATNKDIGQTLEKNTFGKCKKQPNGSGDFLPCQCVIQKWSGFYKKVTFEENKGNPLLEDSKATCPMGAPDCITIDNHGQQAEASKQNTMKANDSVMKAINPTVNMAEVKNKSINNPNVTK
ncbi:DUF4280 domain-containing protein [Flavobacterium sp.]|uniref:DUF4280 domain-containing protein n=1 Tax=Flavobacterium sp. TaxID=239 RepID=UPI00286DFB9B|nr:DUF4280 domain-containing protein [Flavobacterium sp.]